MMKNKKFLTLFSIVTALSLSGCRLIFNGSTMTATVDPGTTTSIDSKEKVESIEINPISLILPIGETAQLTATILPMTATNKNVVWSSSKKTVATIDENGLVSAIAKGSCVITARSSENNTIKATCAIKVENEVIKATSVVLDKPSLQLNLSSKKVETLTATQFPSNATGTVLFKSLDTTVATVDTTGKVTAKDYGHTTIRAFASSDSSIYADCEVVVDRIKVSSVSLDKHTLSVGTGSKPVLTATVLPTDADVKDIYWESSDTTLATVSNGTITTLKAGTVTITAYSDENPNLYDSCVVTITDIAATGLTLSPASLAVSVDTSATISPVFTPSDTTDKSVIWSSNNESIASVSDGVVTGHALGSAVISATSVDGGFVATCDVTVTQIGKTTLDYNYEDFTSNNLYQIDSIPSSGNPKIVVVPVWFTDSNNYLNNANKARVRDDIRKAYFGTNEETGWRSVKTYYEEESFNTLTIDGIVMDWYECGYSSSNVTDTSLTTKIVKNVAQTFKAQNPSTYSDYDTNGDGYFDAFVLIYAAPDYIESHSRNENLWAYCYWTQDAPGTPSMPVPNVYFWASYDFMYSAKDGIGAYAAGDTSHCLLDTHTFIHEAGHMFGLDDYYDYNGGYEAAGRFTMQDYNVGAHDAYSKMALGWVKPYVINKSITVEINPLEDSGDLILLSPNFQDSPFDEYLLIDLYTPTGLNAFDSTYQYENSYPIGPSTSGCRVWHVDSRTAQFVGGNPSYASSYRLSSSPKILSGYSYTKAFTNSTFVSREDGRGSILANSPTDAAANYRALQLIRKDYTTDYRCGDEFNANNLFVTGDSFNMTTYGKCFYNRGKLNNGSSLGYSVHFDHVSSSSATITITKE